MYMLFLSCKVDSAYDTYNSYPVWNTFILTMRFHFFAQFKILLKSVYVQFSTFWVIFLELNCAVAMVVCCGGFATKG